MRSDRLRAGGHRAKAGNVHRFADFEDVTYLDFVLSAAAIGPVLAQAAEKRVGATILSCVQATREVVRTNTNLGIILLFAPLATVSPEEKLRDGICRILAELDVEDARLTYEAIRLAKPGGLKQVAEQDIRAQPTGNLRDVMALAADRDLIALQYANGFAELFDDGVPTLERELTASQSWETAIIRTHMQMMARYPDTLIARKCGIDEAKEAARGAQHVLDNWPDGFAEFDAWLRAREHARIPERRLISSRRVCL